PEFPVEGSGLVEQILQTLRFHRIVQVAPHLVANDLQIIAQSHFLRKAIHGFQSLKNPAASGMPPPPPRQTGVNSGRWTSSQASNTARTRCPIRSDSGRAPTMLVVRRRPSCSSSPTIAMA